ncbi:MAG: family 16 glycoside hydrolase [Akkermansiaceae bacterium]
MIRFSILSALLILPACAQYLSHDPFAAYTTGTEIQSAGNPAISGYSGAWTDIDFGDAEPAVVSGSLVYANPLYAGSSGGGVSKGADTGGIGAANSGRVFRLLDDSLKIDDTTTGTRYLSWLFRTGNENAAAAPNTYQTLALYNGTTANANRNFDAGIAGTGSDFATANYAFRAENSATFVGNLDLAPDANVHLFVAKFTLSASNNGDSVTVWIDPVLGGGEPSGGVTRSGFNTQFDRLALSDYASNSSAWDEIRWGTTFDSVSVLPAQPFFLQQPASQAGHVGDTVIFTADAISNPAPTFQWHFSANGTDWSPVSGATQPVLSINAAPYASTGFYRVVATNTTAAVDSNIATLTMTFPAPDITQQPAPLGVNAGESATFTVVASGVGNLTYQWLKGGEEISNATSATLSLNSVSEADTGVYTVRVTDDAPVSAGLQPLSVFSDPAILILGNLADYEAGLTFRLYDIREAMDQLYPLVPGQTPNLDQKRSTIDWSGSGDFGGYTQQFVVECHADLFVPVSGQHEFRLTSADGSELWIGDSLVIDHDGEHEATSATGEINLTGGLVPLKLRFFQNTGNPVLKLEWRPPGAADFVTVPASSFLTTAGVTRVVAPGKKEIITPGDGSRPGSGQPLNSVHPSWRVTTIHPSSFNPKVGAMAVHPDGRLFITTFNPNQNSTPDPLPGGDGKVWALTHVQGEDPQAVTVTEVAAGLSEPLGMKFIGGELHVTQRTAVTRLRDTNSDGYYETKDDIGSGWISDNYHHFHFGLIEKDGFAYSTLSTSIYFDYPGLNGPNPPNRGTLVRTNLATGEVNYLAGGLRTPNGLCFGPEGEIFQTDNQGAWLPSSRLNHLQQGHFYGHYNITNDGGSSSLFSDQPMTPPAVWFPQNEIANSPSQPLSIPDGPFAGDLLVGDITLGGINRVSLEKVRGTWQGCIYRFTQGLEGGVNRLAWGPNGTLYVGCIGGSGNWSWNRTTTGLQRLTPKSGDPVTFEIGKVSATSTGFEVTYTKPVPAAALENPANFTVKQWSYQPTADYGGAKIGEETLLVSSATASADRTKVRLVIPDLDAGHVVYLKSDPVSDDGSAILSSEVWYTLNEIPGGPFNMLLDQSSILENQPSGSSIGTFSASHDISGETITFSLPSGVADNTFFSINGETLAAAIPFDHELRGSYQVRVRATDESGLFTDSTFSIQIADVPVEYAPRRILLTNAIMPPDHVASALVGRLLMDDEDLGDLQTTTATAPSSAPEVEESFDYVAATSLTGKAGGTGFSAAWEVTGTSSTIPAGSLSYTDDSGIALQTSGNSGFCAPASRNNRALTSARGADGTVTYVSFIADPGSNEHFWGVEFWNGTAVEANRVLQIGNETGFGVRVRNGTNKLFPIPDSNPHFYVVKINHLPGNDSVSVWIDPSLAAEPSSPDLSFTPAETAGSIGFNRVGLSDFVTTSAPVLDEFRLGNDWSSVTPHQAGFPRFEFASGVGDTDNASFSIQGDRLIATAVLSAGIHSVRVKVTDSAGLSFQQPVLVWVGPGHVDSNGDGLSDATAIRLGFDPLAPMAPGAYFGQGGTSPLFGPDPSSSDYLLSAGTLPGNTYWIERSPDLAQWTLEGESVFTPSSFVAAASIWQLPLPGDPRHFWRVAGGWPTAHGINLLANGLAGLTFVGGNAGWTFDSNTGVLRQDSTEPSEWAYFGGTYSDYFLSLDYRLSPNGNSGIFLRCAATGDPWVTGSEIQLTNEPRLPIHSTGSVYDRLPASPAADASHSVWHRLEILMIGDRLRIVVDGVPTVDVADVRAAYPGFDWPTSGLIGLQDSHATGAGTVEYRNIRLVPLAP